MNASTIYRLTITTTGQPAIVRAGLCELHEVAPAHGHYGNDGRYDLTTRYGGPDLSALADAARAFDPTAQVRKTTRRVIVRPPSGLVELHSDLNAAWEAMARENTPHADMRHTMINDPRFRECPHIA